MTTARSELRHYKKTNTLAAVDGDFSRCANPPEMAQEEQGGYPEIFEGEEAKRFG